MMWHLSNHKPDGCHTWLECNQIFRTPVGHCGVRDKRHLKAITVDKIHSKQNHAVSTKQRQAAGCVVHDMVKLGVKMCIGLA